MSFDIQLLNGVQPMVRPIVQPIVRPLPENLPANGPQLPQDALDPLAGERKPQKSGKGLLGNLKRVLRDSHE